MEEHKIYIRNQFGYCLMTVTMTPIKWPSNLCVLLVSNFSGCFLNCEKYYTNLKNSTVCSACLTLPSLIAQRGSLNVESHITMMEAVATCWSKTIRCQCPMPRSIVSHLAIIVTLSACMIGMKHSMCMTSEAGETPIGLVWGKSTHPQACSCA